MVSPARKAGLTPRFNTGKVSWADKLKPFKVWQAVNAKVDPRHVGEVTAIHHNTITVRWPDGSLSEFQAHELESSNG